MIHDVYPYGNLVLSSLTATQIVSSSEITTRDEPWREVLGRKTRTHQF